MAIKSVIKQLLPPIILHTKQLITKKKTKQNFSGNYQSWVAAQKESSGYDANNILEKCKQSLLKIKNGEAVYERDSVLLNKVQYPWPVLVALQHIAIANHKNLSVIDFGGSLGSTYFQIKKFITNLNQLNWTVVEQNQFVTCGKTFFEDQELNFEYSIKAALAKQKSHCIMLSGVLQYLENPYQFLNEVLSHNFEYILFDRTSFIDEKQCITVQNVPNQIYEASYPTWFFNEPDFLKVFETKYEQLSSFNSNFDGDFLNENGKKVQWKGFFFKLKTK